MALYRSCGYAIRRLYYSQKRICRFQQTREVAIKCRQHIAKCNASAPYFKDWNFCVFRTKNASTILFQYTRNHIPVGNLRVLPFFRCFAYGFKKVPVRFYNGVAQFGFPDMTKLHCRYPIEKEPGGNASYPVMPGQVFCMMIKLFRKLR